MGPEIDQGTMQALVEIKSTISSMNDRLQKLETRKPCPPITANFDCREDEYLFWSLTTKQHALLQLELFSFTNIEIENCLGTPEMTARSSTNHLMTILNVGNQNSLASRYLNIFLDADDKKYIAHAKIPKSWAKSYGLLNNKQAKTLDPYFEVVNSPL